MQVVSASIFVYAFMSVGQEKPRPRQRRVCGGGGRDSARFAGRRVRVELPGGRLDIAWKGPGHRYI